MPNTTQLNLGKKIRIILFSLLSPILIIFISSLEFLYPIEEVILISMICLGASRIFIIPLKFMWKRILRGIWTTIIIILISFIFLLNQISMFPDTLVSRSFQISTMTVHYTVRSASWKKHHTLKHKSANIYGTKIESQLLRD